jgi:3-oxoacyl-[acyl-carrier protein] reductase
MQVIRGKKALVTGAASGIGRAIALALAREGADIHLVDIDEPRLAATAHEGQAFGVKVVTSICDLAEPSQITATVKSLQAGWGALDILVNNAGIAYFGPTHEMTAEQWSRMLAINLLAPIQLVRELTPLLATQEEAHILNVCSILGLVPIRKAVAYQTTKFGLVGFSVSLRADYSRGQIGVTALCPGFVLTPMIEVSVPGIPGQRRPRVRAWACTTAEKVAERAMRAIRRNQGIVVVSPVAQLLWWAARLFPGLLDRLVRKRRRRSKPIDVARP